MKYIAACCLVSLLLAGCSIKGEEKEYPVRASHAELEPQEVVLLDTIHHFERAFDTGGGKFYTSEVGMLKVTSGTVSITGPVQFENGHFLETQVPIGNYPVQIALLQSDRNFETIAYSRILINNTSQLTWEPLQFTMNNGDLAEDYIIIESGLVAISDKDGVEFYANEITQNTNLYFDVFVTELFRNSNSLNSNNLDYNTIDYDLNLNNNLIAHTSGDGDGFYPIYLGKDSSGTLCQILIDFEVQN